MNREDEVLLYRQKTIFFCSYIAYIIIPIIWLPSIKKYIYADTDDEIEDRNIYLGSYLLCQLIAICFLCIKVIEYKIYLQRTANPEVYENPPPAQSIEVVIHPPDMEEYQKELNQKYSNHLSCISCWENIRSVKLNCGHAVLCHICAHLLETNKKPCPVCREPITEIKEEVFSDKDYSPSNSSTPPPDELEEILL